MRTPALRISIAGLLAVVLVLGFGFAALATLSPLWENAIFTLMLGLLITAVLGAIYHRKPSLRAFWGGFAIAGWSYLILCTALVLWFDEGRRLATTALMDLAYAQIAAPTEADPGLVARRNLKLDPGNPLPNPGLPAYAPHPAPAAEPGPVTRWALWNRPDRGLGMIRIDGDFYASAPGAFYRIGHDLFSLAAGVLGGALARRFRGSRAEGGPARAG